MARKTQIQQMTEAEYLLAEEKSPFKHEYVDGFVFAMSGATRAHEVICGNIFSFIHSHLRGNPCQAYMAGMKVHIKKAESYYYPDVLVTCEPFEPKSVFTSSPIILVEVLSPSTMQVDKREKLLAYQKIDSLKEYVIVYQDRQRVEVYRRTEPKKWDIVTLTKGDDLLLESMPGGQLSMPLSLIYERHDPPGRVKEEEGSYDPDSLLVSVYV